MLQPRSQLLGQKKKKKATLILGVLLKIFWSVKSQSLRKIYFASCSVPRLKEYLANDEMKAGKEKDY